MTAERNIAQKRLTTSCRKNQKRIGYKRLLRLEDEKNGQDVELTEEQIL